MPRNSKAILWIAVVLALIGFADASYLTAEHFLGGTPVCLAGGGCEQVLTSEYATIGPVPLSLIGALYYLALFFGVLALLQRPNRRLLQAVTWLSGAGFAASLGLIYLQAAVIGAFCTYCIVSASTSTLLFLLLLSLSVRYAEPTKGS